MENRQQQILSEIREMMTSVRAQLEQLEAKMAEFEYEVDPQSFMVDPISLELDDLSLEVPVVEDVEVPVVQEDLPVAQEVEVPVVDDVDDDLPFFEEPVIVHEAAQTVSVEKPAVIDALIERQAWRTDMPGAPVRDIRSAISLNDRVLFINGLFDEDPVVFQEDLTAVNQMKTLDEAVNYLVGRHPSWDLESEIVYRFMMALRRKIN